MARLTPKKKLFAEHYPLSLNATEAAKAAGYSAKTAYSAGQRLLKDVEVQKSIQEVMKARSERTQISADYVLNNLKEVVERCMQRAPVMTRFGQAKDENGADVWEFDSKGANGALKLLGDHLGIFTKKVEVSGDFKGVTEFILGKK